MGRFLQRQIDSAQSKKLGRTEHFYEVDRAKNQINVGERPGDAAERPQNVKKGAFPVGRPSGVCKPGEESQVGRILPGYEEVGGAVPALPKRRRPNR